GDVIVQQFDLNLRNSNVLAYAGNSPPLNHLGSLPGQPTTAPPGATVGPVPYNNNVNLSCVANGTNPPNTSTLNPSAAQPGTPVSFTPTMSHPSVANFNFKIQGVGTDADGLTRSQNVAFHTVTMAYTLSPGSVTVPATGTSAADNFSITTNSAAPGVNFPNA